MIKRALAWLIGVRFIKKDGDVVFVRLPSWFSEKQVDNVIAHLIADARVQGKTIRAERGHRVVRFEVEK